MKGLADKVAVIAGGGQGMGAATARRLAREGARVVVGDLRLERATAVADEIVAAGGEAVAHAFDLADDASVGALIGRAVQTYGGLDLLANVGANTGPGSARLRDTDVASIATEVWDATLQVNLRGYMFTGRHAIPEMVKRGGGSIVCVSSAASAIPMADGVAYSVSKAGVDALVRHIAIRWAAEGIRANAVAPGLIHSESGEFFLQHFGVDPASVSPLGHGGQPDEMGALIAFLLSEECAFLNGQVIPVNGGSFMSPQ